MDAAHCAPAARACGLWNFRRGRIDCPPGSGAPGAGASTRPNSTDPSCEVSRGRSRVLVAFGRQDALFMKNRIPRTRELAIFAAMALVCTLVVAIIGKHEVGFAVMGAPV